MLLNNPRLVVAVAFCVILPLAPCEPAAKEGSRADSPEKSAPVAEKSVSAKEPAAPVAKATVSEDAFFQAALDGKIEKVREGLAGGIKPGLAGKEDKRTALMLAAFNGHTAIIRLLVEAKADVNARDAIDRTALMYAATGPYGETVRYLLDHGAKVNLADNNEHWTPLMFAAAEGQTAVVRMLLEAGAAPGAVDVDGEDAALFAKSKGHAETAALIEAAKVKAKGGAKDAEKQK